MKPRDVFRDIFGLAVRLLGLVFLYLGLSIIPSLLDPAALETASGSDLLTAILPIVFNLLVAWWLIGGGLLVRRAYPETSRISSHSPLRGEGKASTVRPGQLQEMTDMDAAERKLASLVEKPKNRHPA